MAKHLEESPRWILVGFREKTVIVLITHETVMVFSTEDIEEGFEHPGVDLEPTLPDIAENTGSVGDTSGVGDKPRRKRPNPFPEHSLQTATRKRHSPSPGY